MSRYNLRHYGSSTASSLDSQTSGDLSFDCSLQDTFDKLLNAKECKQVKYKDKSAELGAAGAETDLSTGVFSAAHSSQAGYESAVPAPTGRRNPRRKSRPATVKAVTTRAPTSSAAVGSPPKCVTISRSRHTTPASRSLPRSPLSSLSPLNVEQRDATALSATGSVQPKMYRTSATASTDTSTADAAPLSVSLGRSPPAGAAVTAFTSSTPFVKTGEAPLLIEDFSPVCSRQLRTADQSHLPRSAHSARVWPLEHASPLSHGDAIASQPAHEGSQLDQQSPVGAAAAPSLQHADVKHAVVVDDEVKREHSLEKQQNQQQQERDGMGEAMPLYATPERAVPLDTDSDALTTPDRKPSASPLLSVQLPSASQLLSPAANTADESALAAAQQQQQQQQQQCLSPVKTDEHSACTDSPQRDISRSGSCVVCLSVLSETLLGRLPARRPSISASPTSTSGLCVDQTTAEASGALDMAESEPAVPVGVEEVDCQSLTRTSCRPLTAAADHVGATVLVKTGCSHQLTLSPLAQSNAEPSPAATGGAFKEPLPPLLQPRSSAGPRQLVATRFGKGWRRSLVPELTGQSVAAPARRTRHRSSLMLLPSSPLPPPPLPSLSLSMAPSPVASGASGQCTSHQLLADGHTPLRVSRPVLGCCGAAVSRVSLNGASRVGRRSSVYIAPVVDTKLDSEPVPAATAPAAAAAAVSEVSATAQLLDTSWSCRHTAAPLASFAGSEARRALLALCTENTVLSFSAYLRSKNIGRKVGEGVYGEVFLCGKPGADLTVVKIMPIEGALVVNGAEQKKFGEIISELVISKRLSDLRLPDPRASASGSGSGCTSDGFVRLAGAQVVQGRYPYRLKQAWNKYDREKASENESPDCFGADQLFLILEYGHAGTDLEKFTFATPAHALAVVLQVACSLAVAEQRLQFEHRDLHQGNVLVRQSDTPAPPSSSPPPPSVCCLDNGNVTVRLPSVGVQATLIDFTLSRVTVDARVVYNNLAEDEELFTSHGDYQFDIYRMMRQAVEDQWWRFCPVTNVQWLDYLWDKMCTSMLYEQPNSRSCRHQLRQLQLLRPLVLQCHSARELVTRHGAMLSQEVTAMLNTK